MGALGERLIQPGDGIAEAIWLDAWPLTSMATAAWRDWLNPADGGASPRVFIVAPHPDDEVLIAGGMVAQMAAAGIDVHIVAVTDGGASHPGSRQWPAARLLAQRPLETRAALHWLGAARECIRLQLPDGAVRLHRDTLVRRLCWLLAPGDVVVTTWRLDGHPDHEATGDAVAEAAARRQARVLETPVWAWHWCAPDDPRWPWARARRLMLDPESRARKSRALKAYASQLQPDRSTGRGPVLRASIVERAARPFEVFFE